MYYMLKIDTTNCRNGVDASFITSVIDANSHYDGIIYIYDNDMVDEGCKPYSVTAFKPGDKVCKVGENKLIDNKDFIVESISPATYGFMNVFIVDEDGNREISYSGDLVFYKNNS